MLSVHGRIESGDRGMFEEVELVFLGHRGKYSGIPPIKSMLRLCLAGADFMLLMESVKLLLRHAWCSFVRVANGVCEVVAKTCLVFLCPCC